MNCLHLSFTGCGHPGCKRWGNDCESASRPFQAVPLARCRLPVTAWSAANAW